MSQRSLLMVFIFLVLIGGGLFLINKSKPKDKQQLNFTNNTQSTKQTMKLSSSVFANNQPIPSKYTCDGQNVNPPLTISYVPTSAKSLVLIMDDPDAPLGTWVHWTVWNIDPKTTEIAESSVPAGAVEGKTSFGKPGYGGPCPPSGTHHYFFELYSLDTTLSLSPSATKGELEKAMTGHIIQKVELVGIYSRK